jgi:hypothetical protein
MFNETRLIKFMGCTHVLFPWVLLYRDSYDPLRFDHPDLVVFQTRYLCLATVNATANLSVDLALASLIVGS